MQYLANYRSVRGVEDQRAQWVDNIIGEIERFVAEGGDPAAIGALLGAARRGNADDKDISLLAARIEAALATYARSADSSAGVQVVQYFGAYLESADDVIPDRLGRHGLLDDAWLIVNTAFRLIESGLLPASAVPLDWPTIARADALVQAIMPAEALAALPTS